MRRPAASIRNRTRAAVAARVPALAVLVPILFIAAAALAEEPEPVTTPETPAPLLSLGEDIDKSELDENRAMAMLEIDKIFVNDQELNGTVSDNVAINSNNGANSISGDAFNSAAGLINTIQNTGNNVLIQSATIVNVAIEN